MLRVLDQQEIIPLPILEDYDVSPITGFVPYPQPHGRLTSAYYQPWEEIMDRLNELIETRHLRARVDEMPLLQVDQLTGLREHQRAYVVLSIMAHSYIWGHGLDIAQSIPEPLAVPWQAVSNVLDIPPALTYASNDLWNWKLIDEKGPHTLENFTTLHTMTGARDEVWFDTVSVLVEVEGGAALKPLLEAMQAVREDDIETTVQKLGLALPQLQKAGKALSRMFEECDPAVFYWKIRKFLAGSENNAGLGLPNGLIYIGVDNNVPKHFMGATAGQSSIFPALDVILGIQHFEKNLSSSSPQQLSSTPLTTTDNITKATALNDPMALNGGRGEGGAPNSLLQKMRLYMPGPHRAFLDHLAKVANLRDFVLKKSMDENFDSDPAAQALVQIYDTCVHEVKLFRDTHIQVVTRYIMTQARRGPPEGWEDCRVKVEAAPEIKGESGIVEETSMRGSGGSDLMPFLKTNRDETLSTKVIQPTSKK